MRGKAAFGKLTALHSKKREGRGAEEQRPGCATSENERLEARCRWPSPPAPFPLSPLPCFSSKTNKTYPSGEQWCVWRQLTHETRSLDEEDDDEEPLLLRPGFAFAPVVVVAADVDLGALPLLSSPPSAPSSRSRYVSATARRYHSSVATTSSRKARARTRFLLLFRCCR